MNCSTRLRRWVRMRTPPVRVASMKPTAATVLPAPVACSNQKRRAAPGSSAASRDGLLFVFLGRLFLPVLWLLVGGQLLGLLLLLVPRTSSPSGGVGSPSSAAAAGPAPFSAAVCCSDISSVRVPESASTWCGLSSAPSRSFGGSSASSRSSPSSSEKSRRHWIDGMLRPFVELLQRRVEGAAAGGARRERLGALAVEQQRLAGKLSRPLDVGA